jgi:hypothetical protein
MSFLFIYEYCQHNIVVDYTSVPITHSLLLTHDMFRSNNNDHHQMHIFTNKNILVNRLVLLQLETGSSSSRTLHVPWIYNTYN